nr:loricrin [Aegilops tauschii subsp. strangulata]
MATGAKAMLLCALRLLVPALLLLQLCVGAKFHGASRLGGGCGKGGEAAVRGGDGGSMPGSSCLGGRGGGGSMPWSSCLAGGAGCGSMPGSSGLGRGGGGGIMPWSRRPGCGWVSDVVSTVAAGTLFWWVWLA